MTYKEWQFDGLVGPTHNYAGLSIGNVASEKNKNTVSNPREAALQGLGKIRLVHRLTGTQGVFLPQYRPVISELKRLGFDGSNDLLLKKAANSAPELLSSIFSSSAMWAANSATVAPSIDTLDQKLHLTPANLLCKYHRSLEPGFTTQQFRRIFKDSQRFRVHDPLPSSLRFADEGAANHMRIADKHGSIGLHVFIYGKAEHAKLKPHQFPARQHEEACMAIARMHKLDPDKCLFIQQNPEAIDAGIFHHDVIGMNSLGFLAQHEKAWVGGREGLDLIAKKLRPDSLDLLEIPQSELPMEAAVRSYFFNVQLLSGEGGISVIAPSECEEDDRTRRLFEGWIDQKHISEVHYLNVRESMKNGGGPACLRLRVVMNEEEVNSIHQGVVMDEAKIDALEGWVKRYYRDRLSFEDLQDVQLINEVEEALDALTQIVGMENLYPFQLS